MTKVFELGGVDFSAYVDKYGYSVDQKPIYGANVMTLDGIEHPTITRWKSSLTVAIKPLTRAKAKLLYDAIASAAVSVKYYNPHVGTVTQTMRVESVPYNLGLDKSDEQFFSGTSLTFVQN